MLLSRDKDPIFLLGSGSARKKNWIRIRIKFEMKKKYYVLGLNLLILVYILFKMKIIFLYPLLQVGSGSDEKK